MKKNHELFRVFVVLFVISASITLINYPARADEWNVTENDNTLEISYGSGTNFPQYAVLHLNDGYFRLVYGPESGWGTSVILLPSFWEIGFNKAFQGAPVTTTWEFDGEDLVLSIEGTISSLSVEIQLRLFPPAQDSISADVTVNVEGDVVLDPDHIEKNEAFKPVMLSSMHISPDKWDTQAAFVNSQTFPIPEDEWIIYPAVSGNRFGLKGGTSDWKTNAPTIEILLDENRPITGWIAPSDNPDADNIGFWAASDQVLSSWSYTITASKPARTISFSGYEWTVKTTGDGQWGPGPNYFSDSEENVWVDGDSKLHLKITERDGKWYCAEVLSEETLGYGMYRFYVEGRIDLLNENVVLGLFTWDDDPAYAHREIDFEAAKWADPENENAQFVVQPWEPDENMHRFDIQLNGTYSTHSFDWKPDRVFFQSAHGHYADPPATHIIESWRYDGPDVPSTGNEKVHINLWLFQGEPPSDGQEIELVISQFEFVPAPDVEAVKSFETLDQINETPITDVFVGNTITYIIDVTNFLDQNICLLVHDELSSLTTYMDGSFRVNDSLVDDNDFIDGILDYEFSGLEQHETLTLEFDVTVNDGAFHNTMIENMAFVTAYALSGVVLTNLETNTIQIRVENPETVIPKSFILWQK